MTPHEQSGFFLITKHLFERPLVSGFDAEVLQKEAVAEIK